MADQSRISQNRISVQDPVIPARTDQERTDKRAGSVRNSAGGNTLVWNVARLLNGQKPFQTLQTRSLSAELVIFNTKLRQFCPERTILFQCAATIFHVRNSALQSPEGRT